MENEIKKVLQVDPENPSKVLEYQYENGEAIGWPVVADFSMDTYFKSYRILIAKAEQKGNKEEADSLRKEMMEYDASQFQNARMFAASYDMLKALEGSVENLLLHFGPEECRKNSSFRAMEEAIQKAKLTP